MRITINSTVVDDGWTVSNPTPSPITLTVGQPVPIVIDYRKPIGTASMSLTATLSGTGYTIDPTWFSPAARTLPVGWTMTGDGAGLRWRSATVLAATVVLTDVDGTTTTYTRAAGSDPRTGWVPPAGEDDFLKLGSDGTLTVQSSDGLTYVFAPDGSLSSVTTETDDLNPAAASRTYSPGTDTTAPARLRSMTDPVSGRVVTLSYNQAGLFPAGQSACPTTTATGFDAAPPAGMLCQIDLPDGTSTKLFYVAGQLGRVQNPGSAITDLAYSGGLLSKIRDPFVTDVIAAGTSGGGYPDSDVTRDLITYDSSSRVTQVKTPIPQYWSTQPYDTITYTSSSESRVQRFGLNTLTDPNDFLRAVTFDTLGQLLTDKNANGNVAAYTWDAAGVNVIRAHTAGRNSTAIYDVEGRPTDGYGPAPDACFDLNPVSGTYLRPNGTCTTPPVAHSHTDYDGGIQGLSVGFWPNATFQGRPTIHTTGAAGTAALNPNWGTSPPASGIPASAFSARFTGEITMPTAGVYTFTLTGSGTATAWIDDVFEVASTGGTPGVVTTPSLPAGAHRIQIDVTNTTGAASMSLQWSYPGQSTVVVPSTAVKPRYGLATQSTGDDSGSAPSQVVSTRYDEGIDPVYALATSTTVDPSGLALKTSIGYETPGSGFLRRLTRTLPSGNATATVYYPNSTVVAGLPCGLGTSSQYGLAKTTTGPTGANGQAVAGEAAYDILGRTVGSHNGTDPWTCVTYDTRGRVTTRTIPAIGTSAARTVTTTFNVGGDPRTTTVADAVGTIKTIVDLAGRTTDYYDVWGKYTSFYFDDAGKLGHSTGPAGQIDLGQDKTYALTAMNLDTLAVANVFYTSGADGGELSQFSYPNGINTTGNGTETAPLARDQAGNLTGLQWRRSSGWSNLNSDSVTRSQSGRILTDTNVDANALTKTTSYTYDSGGRLTQAAVTGDHTWTYGYGTATCTGVTGAVAGAGKNTNRITTSDTLAGVTTNTASCYDAADRLLSTTITGYSGTITYDAHGNTSTLAGQTIGYDQTNRHLTTTTGTTTVTYTRDALDRIVARTSGAVTERYAFSDNSDRPVAVTDTAGTVTERQVALPGGVLLTRHASSDTWSYPNIHGDIILTTHQANAVTGGPYRYDPYGNPVGSSVDNSTSQLDYGWLGQLQRPLEHASGIQPTIEMGARPYNPALGRFAAGDPIEGGTENSYTYPGDPVNGGDPTGTISCSSYRSLCDRYHSYAGNAWNIYFGFSAGSLTVIRLLVRAGQLWHYQLDWGSDSCSSWAGIAINAVFFGAFGNSCGRHDFGYRNAFRIFNAANESGRAIVDRTLGNDLYAVCGGWSMWVTGRHWACQYAADALYYGVRIWGRPYYG